MSSLQRNFQFWHAIETVASGATDMVPMTPQQVAADSRVMAAAKRPGNTLDVASVMTQLHKKGVLRRVARGEYAYVSQANRIVGMLFGNTIAPPPKVSTPTTSGCSSEINTPKVHAGKLRQVCITDNGVDIVLTVGPGGKITIKEV